MTIGVLATITVQEGKNEEFERIFLELIEQVRNNEPGNIFYALTAHSKSEHFQKANVELAGLVAAAPEIELLDTV